MNSFNINNKEPKENNKVKSKGKSALDLLHKDIIKENEKNINLKISDMYGVDFDEAYEIHINYHTLRIKNLIKKTDILYNMISTIENYFDIPNLSSKVVNGEITENSCIDMLINAVKNQSQSQRKDRYINFYS